MGHPDYVYTPRSSEVRAKMSLAQRRRLGIPDGHARIYGVLVPEQHVDRLRPYLAEMARLHGYDRAHAFAKEAAAASWLPDMPQLTEPKKIIDWALVAELLSEAMTLQEVADFLNSPVWYVEQRTRGLRRINKRVTGAGRRMHV